MIKEFIKKVLCQHQSISTTTEVKDDDILCIISSLIKCSDCGKTFPQHPNAKCCYISHLHNEIIRDRFALQLQKYKQQV